MVADPLVLILVVAVAVLLVATLAPGRRAAGTPYRPNGLAPAVVIVVALVLVVILLDHAGRP